MLNRELNWDALGEAFRTAEPFPSICIEQLLDPGVVRAASESFPPFEQAVRVGDTFKTVNEKHKVQVCDPVEFPSAVTAIMDCFASADFLAKLSAMSGIPNLKFDPTFAGGGMHQTASSGLLDVHVDFNFQHELQMHRRLNLLLYLNPVWEESWGGYVELWDRDVKHRHQFLAPELNRCVIFETSEISFHGVTAVTCPQGVARKSIALYYYTDEAPSHFTGVKHDTIFKARPDEKVKKFLSMPAEKLKKTARSQVRDAKAKVKKLLGKD